jgi:hypothetical protein
VLCQHACMVAATLDYARCSRWQKMTPSIIWHPASTCIKSVALIATHSLVHYL